MKKLVVALILCALTVTGGCGTVANAGSGTDRQATVEAEESYAVRNNVPAQQVSQAVSKTAKDTTKNAPQANTYVCPNGNPECEQNGACINNGNCIGNDGSYNHDGYADGNSGYHHQEHGNDNRSYGHHGGSHH